MPLPSNNNKKMPSLPDLDDEVIFEQVDPFEEEKPQPEIKTKRTKIPKMQEETEEDPFYEDEKIENEYEGIDKEKLKIKPTKMKRSVKAGEFDTRKNLASRARGIRYASYAVVLALFLFGARNTFFPPDRYSEEQIREMVRQETKTTGFPVQQGAQVAKDFTKELLTTGGDSEAARERLAKYISPEDKEAGSLSEKFMSISGKSNQMVIGEPEVFESLNLTKNLATYKVTALVSDDDGTTEQKEGEQKDKTHRISIYLNMYYDDKTGKMSIITDSISLIGNPVLAKDDKVPDAQALGEEEKTESIIKSMSPTIYGFIEAFGESDINNTDKIEQYVSKDADLSVYNGFSGNVILDGDIKQAVQFGVYNSSENEWKIFTKVKWKDIQASNNSISYTSTYSITITKQGDKYLVTKISPYTHVPEEKTEEEK